MCPDIETFAPLIEATFGSGASDDPDLRVRLADRSLRQTNPLLNVISQLLTLAEERVTASQLLDLADRAPVRRRFGFDDDSVARMQDWVLESGIRWGFDASHRKPFKLDALEANTWRAGLDRILVGVAMTEHDRRLVASKVLPLDDVESGVIDLAGRFAEFVARAQYAVDQLQKPKPIPDWCSALAEAVDALTATTGRETWQRTELQRLLDDLTENATGTGALTENATATASLLELADIRALLAERLRGRPTRANFRTGNLTVCTLVPMRSVPHRVVCVLGLDDGAFPRKAPRDGDDLLLRRPHVGDRDPRAEDRQMLLDALLAATERLVITYTGNDERTNLPRPPAVPVGELLDIVDRTVSTSGASARERVVIRHPLQPFDPRNFQSGALTPNDRWSFDRTSLNGARALTGTRTDPPAFLTGPLAPTTNEVIELQRLVRFVEHPARAFLRDRLGVSVGEYFDEVEDSLPVELDGLGEWQVGQRLLEGVLEGQELKTCVQAEFARGSLPPGTLANPVIKSVAQRVQRIAAALAPQQTGPAASLDVNLELPDGRRLTGTVPGVCGHTIRIASYSRVKPKDRLRAWVWLLALSAARPEQAYDSIVVGRARSRTAELTTATIPPLAQDAPTRKQRALEALTTLVDLYDRGMREPLPLACESSAAYAEAAYAGDDAHDAARYAWESGFNFDKEDRDPAHVAVHNGTLKLNDLLEQQPRHDEHGPGWPESEQTRFGRYARRLWDPLIERELITDQ